MKFYPRKRRMPQVIIVSLIDIFAILLIFVIVTTTFKVPQPEQPSVTIKLPESKTAVAADKPSELGILSISEKEEIFLDAMPLTIEELSKAIAERLRQNPKQGFAMRADERISYGFLIKVLDALKQGGVKANLSAFTDAKK
jgi:biopolymer transport protein ExbD